MLCEETVFVLFESLSQCVRMGPFGSILKRTGAWIV